MVRTGMPNDLMKAIRLRFKNDLTVSENMISFIKDFIHKNAKNYLDVQVHPEVETAEDIHGPGMVITNRVRISVTPLMDSESFEFVFKERESYENIISGRKTGNVREYERAAATLGPRFGRWR